LPPGNIYIIIRQFDKTVKIYSDSNVNELLVQLSHSRDKRQVNHTGITAPGYVLYCTCHTMR